MSRSVMLLSCFVVSFSTYLTSLNCGLVFDDSAAIVKNYDLRPAHSWTELFKNDFWGTNMKSERSHKSYRPITVLTFRLNYVIAELESFGYHLVNVVLHSLASCAFFYFLTNRVVFTEESEVSDSKKWKNKVTTQSKQCEKTMFASSTAFIASLLFAVHPVHVEAVTGVVGRAEILSFLFSVCALHMSAIYADCFSAKSFTRSLASFTALTVSIGCAMLCKETGITIVAVCAVFDLYFHCQKSVKDVCEELLPYIIWSESKSNWSMSRWMRRFLIRQILLAFSLLLLVALRVWFVQGGQLPSFTAFDNPAAMADSPTRELTLNYLLPVNAWLLMCPWWLCCDWSMGTIPLIQSASDPRNIASVLFWICAVATCKRCFARKDVLTCQISFAVSLILFPFIPASNLFFPVGFVVAERVLYTPSAGFCILVALGFQEMGRRFNSERGSPKAGMVLRLVMAIVIAAFIAKTATRNLDWENEFSLFISAVKSNKLNAKCWNNVGHSLESQERFWEALAFFYQATKVQPDDVGAIINVARTYKNLDMKRDAEKWFYHAIDFIPSKNTGADSQSDGQGTSSVINKVGNSTRMNPNYLFAFISLANMIKDDPSRMEEADKLYQKAYTMRYDQVDAYINRGELLIRQERTAEAREMFLRARQYDEKNADVWYNLGVTYLLEKRTAESFGFFKKALTLDPTHKRSKFNYAALLLELPSDSKEANERQAVRLLEELYEDNSELKVASRLASYYVDTNRKRDSLVWHKRAVELNPSDVSALFNLALVLNELNEHAESMLYVERALKINPAYVKGLALKGDILTKTGQLEDANKEFRKALDMDPNHLVSGHNLCVNMFNIYKPKVPQTVLDCFQKYSKLAPEDHAIHEHYNWILSQIK